jgi:hypothetical protein
MLQTCGCSGCSCCNFIEMVVDFYCKLIYSKKSSNQFLVASNTYFCFFNHLGFLLKLFDDFGSKENINNKSFV